MLLAGRQAACLSLRSVSTQLRVAACGGVRRGCGLHGPSSAHPRFNCSHPSSKAAAARWKTPKQRRLARNSRLTARLPGCQHAPWRPSGCPQRPGSACRTPAGAGGLQPAGARLPACAQGRRWRPTPWPWPQKQWRAGRRPSASTAGTAAAALSRRWRPAVQSSQPPYLHCRTAVQAFIERPDATRLLLFVEGKELVAVSPQPRR